MGTYRFPMEIREVIQDALPTDTSLFGSIPRLQYTYFPAGHAKALHPDSMLVEGIRGSGKSFWWAALQSAEHRLLLDTILPKTGITEKTFVSQGFGEKPSPDNYPGRDALADLLISFDARQIWRTILVVHLMRESRENLAPLANLNSWRERINWVHRHPEEIERLIFDADRQLDRSGSYHLILFDALDRTTDDWKSMYSLVKGLLQVLLEFRPYKRIRPKAFVRPDHLEDSAVGDFPDSSKVLTSKVQLSWPRNDLYGLFLQHLANEQENGHLFRDACQDGFGIRWSKHEHLFLVPEKLRDEEEFQRGVFHAMTGPWMGPTARHGFPYTWLPNHLGDSRRQVSPRTFLAALRHAAADSTRADHPYPLHYGSIRRSVQEAAKIRVFEMQEDYAWVETLMEPLEGLAVPCPFEEIAGRWKDDETLEKLRRRILQAWVKLPPAHIDSDAAGIRVDLEDLGLFERMRDGRVNLPDVYRVGYRIRRRGGVKVVARE